MIEYAAQLNDYRLRCPARTAPALLHYRDSPEVDTALHLHSLFGVIVRMSGGKKHDSIGYRLYGMQ